MEKLDKNRKEKIGWMLLAEKSMKKIWDNKKIRGFGKIFMISQRDILLVPFPFSDQSGRKVRPVIIISNEEFNEYSEDVLIMGITSNISKDKYSIPLLNNSIEEGKLFVPCCIKVENILKIDKGLIIKKIGKIKREKLNEIMDKIIKIIK